MPTAPGQKPFPYPCHVINLERQPERLAEFRRWNADCGLTIERFPAVDGSALDEAARRQVSLMDSTPGTIGNAASHKRLWEHTVSEMRPQVVFEDDAVLRSDIAETLPGVIAGIGGFWDILLLGFNTNFFIKLRPGEPFEGSLQFSTHPSEAELSAHRDSRGAVRAYRLDKAFGIWGYVISPLGARKLLEQCFPITPRTLLLPGIPPVAFVTLDGPMNVIYPSIGAHICLPPLAMSPNDPGTSHTVPKSQKRKLRPKSGRRPARGRRP